MGRFSELDILLKDLPHDREDPIYSTTGRKALEKKDYSPEQVSVWGLSNDEIIAAIGATSPTALAGSLVDRLIAEEKTKDIRPKVHQKKRG